MNESKTYKRSTNKTLAFGEYKQINKLLAKVTEKKTLKNIK